MVKRWLIAVGSVVGVFASAALGRDANTPDESDGYTLPDVTVTAPRDHDYTTLAPRDLIERPFAESPGLDAATSVVGRREIEQMHAYSIVDAMKYVPGAWTETRGRKVKSFYSIRGQRYPYPGYLIDGAWFREFHETNFYLGAANFDRIEVLRSSSSLLWGPGGMTGMINLVPRRYTQRETQLESMYGTHNMFRGDLAHGASGPDYNYGIGTGYYHSDGSDGMNAGENMTNLFGRWECRLAEDATFSWTNFGLFGDRELKLAELPASSTFQTRRDSFDPMHTYLTVAKLRHEPDSDSATELIGNYGGRRYDAHRSASDGWLEEDYEYGTSVIHSRRITSENTLRLNLLYNRWVSPTGKRFYVGNPADLRTYSGAVVDDHDFGKLDVSVGYRYTRDHTKQFGGFDVEGSAAGISSVEVRDEWEEPLHTVNIGASYELTPSVSVFANTAWGQISARQGMLDQELRRPGTETRCKFDLGIKKFMEDLGEAGVTGFFVHQDDAALLSNQKVTVDGEDFALFENGDRKNYGVELDVRSNRFANGIQIFVNATAMKTKRTRDGNWESDEEIPDVILGGGISYAFDKFELTLSGSHVSDYENERFLPSGAPPASLGDCYELNAQLTYRHDEKTDLFVRVDNVTDDEYSTVVGYPHDGTLVYGGMVKRF